MILALILGVCLFCLGMFGKGPREEILVMFTLTGVTLVAMAAVGNEILEKLKK